MKKTSWIGNIPGEEGASHDGAGAFKVECSLRQDPKQERTYQATCRAQYLDYTLAEISTGSGWSSRFASETETPSITTDSLRRSNTAEENLRLGHAWRPVVIVYRSGGLFWAEGWA